MYEDNIIDKLYSLNLTGKRKKRVKHLIEYIPALVVKLASKGYHNLLYFMEQNKLTEMFTVGFNLLNQNTLDTKEKRLEFFLQLDSVLREFLQLIYDFILTGKCEKISPEESIGLLTDLIMDYTIIKD